MTDSANEPPPNNAGKQQHDRYGMPIDQRRLEFEHLALRGLYVVMWIPFSLVHMRYLAMMWRADALNYLDKHGRQGQAPVDYRRNESFPELPNKVETP